MGEIGESIGVARAAPLPGAPPRYEEAPQTQLLSPESFVRLAVDIVEASSPDEITDRPILYELARGEWTLTAATELRLGHPLGDGSARTSWRVRSSDGLAQRSSGSTGPQRVGLVMASAQDGAATLVDLVAARIGVLVGPATLVEERLAQIAGDLSARRWNDIGRLLTVGFVPAMLGPTDRACVSVSEACALLDQPAVGVLGATVVLVAPTCCDEGLAIDRLVTISKALTDCGLLLTAVHPEAGVILAPSRVRPDGVILPASGTSPRAVVETSEADPFERTYPSPESIEVAILGPIEVRGSEVALERRPKLTELVVYLAMHPAGATTRTWATALWPERRVPPQTIANRLSEARRALGFASDGRPRLRRNGERHLIAEISTDWDRFVELSSPDAGPVNWREALALLRGRPFDDLHESQWTALEGLLGEIEQAVVECGLRFGEHALANAQPDDAVWAAQKALRTSPWDERLHRLLMRAADAAGNRAGVEATLRNLALVLEIDGDPLRGVHPETAALYARLSGRQAVVTG